VPFPRRVYIGQDGSKAAKDVRILQSVTANRDQKRIVPIVLGVAMLASIVAAGLLANTNTGAAPIQTSSIGSTPSSSTVSPYVYLGVAAAVIVAGLLLALFLLRRRRPPSGTVPPVQAWQGGPGAGGPPTVPSPPPPPPGVAPAYLETPADVGHAPPPAPGTIGAAAGARAAAGAATGEPAPDIDSLMAELDKISGEILRRGPKKDAGGTGTEAVAESEADR
jgi:hypothetical protein